MKGVLTVAKYTAELNEIVQIKNGQLETVFDDILSDYPLFSEAYRSALNIKIIKHYYFQEIGFETAERFVFEINRKMGEIMPYYNQLYLSLIDINPLINFKKVTTQTDTGTEVESESLTQASTQNQNTLDTVAQTDREIETRETTDSRNETLNNETNALRAKNQTNVTDQTASSAGTTSTTGVAKDVKSDTPTSQILSGDITDNYYASEAAVNNTSTAADTSNIQNTKDTQKEDVSETDETVQTQTSVSALTSGTLKDSEKTSSASKGSTVKNTGESTQNKDNQKDVSRNVYANEEGSTISESELLIRYRETFLNIDMDVINDLKLMFMQIL